MEYEIERLLFQQIDRPKNHLMTKIINVFHDYYRINVYTEIEEDDLIKRKISQSYLATFRNNVLNIIPENDKKPDDLKKKR